MLPLIIAGVQLGLDALGQVMGHSAQDKAAAASEEAARQQKQAVIGAANQSAKVENQQIDMQLEEEQGSLDSTISALADQRSETRMAARQSILASDRAARMASGQAQLSAGAAGVAGASVDALLNDTNVQAATSRQSIGTNLDAANRQLDRQVSATRTSAFYQMRDTAAQRAEVEANRQNRIAGVANIQTAPRSNPFATALGITGSLLNFGQQLYTNNGGGMAGAGTKSVPAASGSYMTPVSTVS